MFPKITAGLNVVIRSQNCSGPAYTFSQFYIIISLRPKPNEELEPHSALQSDLKLSIILSVVADRKFFLSSDEMWEGTMILSVPLVDSRYPRSTGENEKKGACCSSGAPAHTGRLTPTPTGSTIGRPALLTDHRHVNSYFCDYPSELPVYYLVKLRSFFDVPTMSDSFHLFC